MSKNPKSQPEAKPITLNLSTRHAETFHAISALRAYLDLMEQQMPIVQACELASLEAERSTAKDEEEHSSHSSYINYIEQLFEDDLFPTMRYSFVVFLHTIFETRMRGFCVGVQRERKLPIGLTDLKGRELEQANSYLSKLVGIPVGTFPEWSNLRRFQDIRDCIVHHYGYLNPKDDRHKSIRQFAANSDGVTITTDDRIHFSRVFCELHLTNIENFFKRLIAAERRVAPET